MKVMGLNNDKVDGSYYIVKTETGEFVLLHEDFYEFSYSWSEVDDDLVEEANFAYDFYEQFSKFFVEEIDLLEYIYRRGWSKEKDFNVQDFRKFYEGLVRNAFTN